MLKIVPSKLIASLTMAIASITVAPISSLAFSVCGLQEPEATYRTETRLITICIGEASFQLIMTYLDGTGYTRIPVIQEGDLFRGSDGQHNYIIDNNTFVIGTDGEPPIRERVIEANR